VITWEHRRRRGVAGLRRQRGRRGAPIAQTDPDTKPGHSDHEAERRCHAGAADLEALVAAHDAVENLRCRLRGVGAI